MASEEEKPQEVVAVQKPNKVRPGITSRVIADPKEWYECAFLVPHEAIRVMQNNINKGFSQVRPEPRHAWKLKRLFKYVLEVFVRFVHDHHDGEEKMFFPLFVEKAKFTHDTLSEEHETLMENLHRIETLAKDFMGKKEAITAEDMKTALEAAQVFQEMAKEMENHLAEEEETFTPVLRDHFTEQEFGKLEEKLLEELKDDIPRILGAVYEPMAAWGPPGYQAAFMNKIPFIPRQLAYSTWLPNYRAEMVNTFGALFEEDEPPLIASTAWACNVL